MQQLHFPKARHTIHLGTFVFSSSSQTQISSKVRNKPSATLNSKVSAGVLLRESFFPLNQLQKEATSVNRRWRYIDI